MRKNKLKALLMAFTCVCAGLIGSPDVLGQGFHGASIQKTPTGPTGAAKAHVGETITARIRVRNLDEFEDTLLITNIVDVIHHGTGDVTTPNLLAAPVLLSYLQFVQTTNTYIVQPTDPAVLMDDAIAGGIDNHDGIDGTDIKQDFLITFPGQIQVLRPCIVVTKSCVNGVGGNGLIQWSGSVSNCGDVVLTNVVVSNLVNGAMSLVFGPVSLNTNQILFFSGSYPGGCAPVTDTLLASGVDELGLIVRSTASATCSNLITTGIAVTKECPAGAVQPGGILTFTGTVTNTGNVTLTNVVVVNNQPAPGTPVLVSVTLAPGEFRRFTNSYTTPLNQCGPWSDTLTATARSTCGVSVTNTASATCQSATTPQIVVRKDCPAAPTPPGGLLVFSGYVSNSGNISLTNVVVVNDKPAPGTPVVGPITLAPGGFLRFTNSYTTPLNQCGPWIDTLVASGRSICGANVTNTATAVCPAVTTPQIVVTKNCPPEPTAPGGLLVFSGTVSNAGNITLTNVVVVNNKPTNGTPVFGPVTLLPGEIRSFSGSYVTPPDSCGPYSDTLTATARSICGSNISHTATAVCPSLPLPRLVVEKFCPTNPVPFDGLFVYTGYVSNAGNVTLTNVLVYDDKPVANTLVLGPTNLAPGQVAFFTGSYNVNCCCGPHHDMVTAYGTDKCTGTVLTRTRTAVCPAINYPGIALTRTCPTGPAVVGQPVYFSGIMTNTGNVVLSNVVVVGSDGATIVRCLGLTPGEYQEYTGSFILTNCVNGFATNTITLTGYDMCNGAVVSSTATCIINCQGGGGGGLVLSPNLVQDKFGLTFNSEAGKSYTIQYMDTVDGSKVAAWHTLTSVAGTGQKVVVQDDRTSSQRFYRVIQNP